MGAERGIKGRTSTSEMCLSRTAKYLTEDICASASTSKAEFLEDTSEINVTKDVFLGKSPLKAFCPERVILLSFF
jgi:hypothetical protein